MRVGSARGTVTTKDGRYRELAATRGSDAAGTTPSARANSAATDDEGPRRSGTLGRVVTSFAERWSQWSVRGTYTQEYITHVHQPRALRRALDRPPSSRQKRRCSTVWARSAGDGHLGGLVRTCLDQVPSWPSWSRESRTSSSACSRGTRIRPDGSVSQEGVVPLDPRCRVLRRAHERGRRSSNAGCGPRRWAGWSAIRARR